MMLAPLFSGFYPFLYSFSVKLLIDAIVIPTEITYAQLSFPIILFLTTHVLLDLIWRVSNIAAWNLEPYVKRSILLKTYDYVQHHSYSFFQDNLTGAISSKVKGVLDGYDRFYGEMHHGLGPRVLKVCVSMVALSCLNQTLGLFMLLWALIYVLVLSGLSKRMNQLSFEETECRHGLIGQISDKISNMSSVFAFASRKREFDALEKQISHNLVPKQIIVYKYHFKFS